MTLQILIEAIGLLPLLVLVAVVVWRRRQLDKDDRRDPITTELRNLPGHSLQEQFEKLYESRITTIMERLSEGGSALMINHGGVVELGVVGCLAEPDFSAWGDAVNYCEGARLFWDDGPFTHGEVLRVPK